MLVLVFGLFLSSCFVPEFGETLNLSCVCFCYRWAKFFGFRSGCLFGHGPYRLCVCVVLLNHVDDIFRCLVNVCMGGGG